MKAVILSTLLATAVAFAPQQQARTSTSLNEFVRGYVGGEGPEPMFVGETGSKNFDPVVVDCKVMCLRYGAHVPNPPN